MAAATNEVSVLTATKGRRQVRMLEAPAAKPTSLPEQSEGSPSASVTTTLTGPAATAGAPPSNPKKDDPQIIFKRIDLYTKWELESLIRKVTHEHGIQIELWVVLHDIQPGIDLDDDMRSALKTSPFPIYVYTRFELKNDLKH